MIHVPDSAVEVIRGADLQLLQQQHKMFLDCLNIFAVSPGTTCDEMELLGGLSDFLGDLIGELEDAN